MPTLSTNIKNRVRKLPKPSNASQALQPLFEAVSNGFYAIEDRFGSEKVRQGFVNIRVENLSNSDKIRIEISDTGIGLDEDRYAAFQVIDTPFKMQKGGKGVGRLFWLDAFQTVKVESMFIENGQLKKRCFRFALNDEEQIIEEDSPEGYTGRRKLGTTIICEGLRGKSYPKQFPKQKPTFLRYFSAHFIADFLVGNCAPVRVDLDGEITSYPTATSSLVKKRDLDIKAIEVEEYGEFSINGFACDKDASTGLDGNHQLHLLANGRTVESRKIDGLIGLKSLSFDNEDELIFHGCVSGNFFDDRVNEGRTAFNIPEKLIKELTRSIVIEIRAQLLSDNMERYEQGRKENFENFVKRYPIYGFDDSNKQLEKLPYNANSAEDFASGLVKHQIRNEEERQIAIEEAIKVLEGEEEISESFQNTLQNALQEIKASEQLALAQHVVRRKLVLELMDKLLTRVRERENKEDDFHLEKTLHSFIVPMNVQGNDVNTKKSRSHDLWVLDERLAFTRAFSSDKRFDKLLVDSKNEDRADLIVWDFASGLGVTDPNKNTDKVDTTRPLDKVMIVEFKRPGRRSYGTDEQIHFQITKYINELRGEEIESFNRERIRIADDCVFYCYVVADIIGDLKTQLSTWPKSANGQGRFMSLGGDVNGSIEVIQWQDLVNDAWSRNEATLFAAGLRRQ